MYFYSVTNLLKAAASRFPASEDTSFFSHRAALAVFCAILSDVIHPGFLSEFMLVQVSGMDIHPNGHSFQMEVCFYLLSLVCAI